MAPRNPKSNKHGAVMVIALIAIVLMFYLGQEEQTTQIVVKEEGGSQKKVEKRIRPIKQISILGERNSGTRWTYE